MLAQNRQKTRSQGRPEVPYGHDYGGGANDYMGGLFVGAVADPAGIGRAYLGFPLAVMPPGCSLEAAWLTAYLNRVDSDCCPAETPIAAHGLYDPAALWDEVTLSWSTAPALADNALSVLDGPFAARAWLRWDVTPEVALAYSGEWPRVSLALRAIDDLSPEPAASWKYLAERGFGIAGRPETYHPARLELIWSAAQNFSGSWHLMALPLAPSDPDPPVVFAPHPISGNLTRWDAVKKKYITYYSWKPSEFGPCQTGVGYWLRLASTKTLSYYGIDYLLDQRLTLASVGWQLIGHPFATAVALDRRTPAIC
jgi:hypothetical protein